MPQIDGRGSRAPVRAPAYVEPLDEGSSVDNATDMEDAAPSGATETANAAPTKDGHRGYRL